MRPTREMLSGAVIGTAIGDALGMPLEFVSHNDIPDRPIKSFMHGKTFGGPCPNLNHGQWTDDTQMMLLVLESLLNKKKVDIPDIQKRLRSWADSDDQRFPGSACMQAAISGAPTKSEGCGSIMRTLPLGFLLSEEEAVKIGRTTHLSENTDRWVAFLHRAVFSPDGVQSARNYAAKFFNNEEKLWHGGNSGWVIDTGMSALKAVLETDNFMDALVTAVNMGGDTDSIGAVAGGLAGAWYTFDGIPEEYLLGLEQGGRLRHLSDMLYETFSERFQ